MAARPRKPDAPGAIFSVRFPSALRQERPIGSSIRNYRVWPEAVGQLSGASLEELTLIAWGYGTAALPEVIKPRGLLLFLLLPLMALLYREGARGTGSSH